MERIFSYFWKNKIERKKNKPGALFFEEFEEHARVYAQLAYGKNEKIDLGASFWGCGFVDNYLLLPEIISWTGNKKENFELLKVLILKALAVKELNITCSFPDRSRSWPRLFILSQSHRINNWLDERFCSFVDFEAKVIQTLIDRLPQFLKSGYEYKYWYSMVSNRDERNSIIAQERLVYFKKKEKINGEPSIFLHATVPLPYRKTSTQHPVDKAVNSRKENSPITTHKKRNRKEFVEDSTPIDKKKINPVMHSFEKIETLDDYSGQDRISSGDDELDRHSSALDELELNRHTNEGLTSSVYRQDSEPFKASSTAPVLASCPEQYKYPEWFYSEQRYLKDYCSVFEIKPDLKPDEALSQKIYNRYTNEIMYWQRQINKIFNEPLWRGKLVDGSDLDLDQVVRLQPEFKSFCGEPQIYQAKKTEKNDIGIFFLVDVSYSTDAWLDSSKIIDMIRDAVAVSGFMLKDFVSFSSVALTFSQTRKNISYLEVKAVTDSWPVFMSRLNEFCSREYTRLGPAIRHATYKALQNKCRKSILVVVTDGKPTDLDAYEGVHGQQDVRRALDEAQRLGLNVLTMAISDTDKATLNRTFSDLRLIFKPDDFCRELIRYMASRISKRSF